jgi:acyl-CoA synthetase (AMP-forming)/AMP-acid ligase II
MNLFSLLEQSATRFARRDAVYLGKGCLLSYDDLRVRALALASGMLGEVSPGDRVAIVSKNCPQYVELMFAAWAAGLVITPINAKLHPREIVDIIAQCQSRLVFASADLEAGIAPLLGRDRPAPTIIGIGGEAYDGLLSSPATIAAEVDPDALAWLFYTSGTTGRSKGAMLSHRNLLAMTIAYLADFESVEAEHSLIHAAPMSHGSGLYVLPFTARGARHVIPASGGYHVEEYIQLCRFHPDCSSFLAPTMVQRLCAEIGRHAVQPTNLRTIVYGGGPMYVEDIRSAKQRLGGVFIQVYGQGEAPMTITGLRRRDHESDDPAVLGSVGWPRSGVEVRITAANGEVLPVGEIGEICCRGDVVMQGYWDDPDATSAALKDGWLRTGDIGFLDADGKLTLRDRSKDVIISGGTNIYPREVEEVLLTHASVAEACVVGKPDREWGEVVAAFVVKVPGTQVTTAELDDHCLGQIARFKRPKIYTFVAALPKNSYGKVLRRELAAQCATETPNAPIPPG